MAVTRLGLHGGPRPPYAGFTARDPSVVVEVGTPITNAGVTATLSNYEVDPMSGFRQYPINDPYSKLKKRWDGQFVRTKSMDPRHPQEFVKSRGNHPQTGPQSTERDDTFIDVAVSADDL